MLSLILLSVAFYYYHADNIMLSVVIMNIVMLSVVMMSSQPPLSTYSYPILRGSHLSWSVKK
jgi:hypothetical protein